MLTADIVGLEGKGGLLNSPPAESRPRPSPRSRHSSHSSSFTSPGLPGTSTETIIDALFNPHPSSSSIQTPFTYPAPPRSAASTPSSPSGSESVVLDRLVSARLPESPRTPAASRLAHLTKLEPSPPKRKDPADPNDKGGRWWRLGSNPRPTTPAHTHGAESDPEARRPANTNSKGFAAYSYLESAARKPPSIAVTDAG